MDVFDMNYSWVGQKLKSEVHKFGLWHRVFSCVVIDSKSNTVYFQKKKDKLYDFVRPNYIDISVGGHYIAGEKIEDGIREFKEETGQMISFNDLHPLGLRKSVFSIDNTYNCCEFQHVFLYDFAGKSVYFDGSEKEIKSILEVDIDDFYQLLIGQTKTVVVQRSWPTMQDKECLTIRDIDPAFLSGDQFLLRLVIAARRYVRGDNPEEIFW